MKDKQAAEKVGVAILNGDNATLDPKMKTLNFTGIARFVPLEFDENSLVTIITNYGKAEQFRTTRSFNLQFSAKADLDDTIRNPPMFGYERIRIDKFIYVPCRCNNCQDFGHLAAKCENA